MTNAAVEAVRARAIALLLEGDRQLALASDAQTYARGKVPAVLLAIARPTGSVVLAIDASEFNGLDVLKLAGFPTTPVDKRRVTI